MIFKTDNLRWYQLPVLVVLLGAAALLALPVVVCSAARRQLCGARY